MAEPTPVLSPQRLPEPLVYRPLSASALAGLIMAAAYTAIIIILAFVALFSHAPAFLPGWTFLIPIVAFGLAVVARLQIRRSEGTRTGMVLANWACWLSLLAGLGYAAFYVGAYLAVVRVDAEKFTNRWFDKIRQGKTNEALLNEAFLDTRPPAERKSDRGEDIRRMQMRYDLGRPGMLKGVLTNFKESELVRIVQDGGPETTIKLRGIRSWDYQEGGYLVDQTYQVTTRQGTFDVALQVRGSVGKEFAGRQWHVVWQKAEIADRKLTPLGETLETWRRLAPRFVNDWLAKRSEGKFLEAYLDTRERSQRGRLREQWQHETLRVLSGLAAGGATLAVAGQALPPPWLAHLAAQDVGREGYRDSYKKFLAGGLIHCDWNKFEARDADQETKDKMIREVSRLFNKPSTLIITMPQAWPRPKLLERDQVQVSQDLALTILDTSQTTSRPKYQCEGTLVLESDAGPLSPERQPAWRVVRLELERGGLATAEDRMRGMAGNPDFAGPGLHGIPLPEPPPLPPPNR